MTTLTKEELPNKVIPLVVKPLLDASNQYVQILTTMSLETNYKKRKELATRVIDEIAKLTTYAVAFTTNTVYDLIKDSDVDG